VNETDYYPEIKLYFENKFRQRFPTCELYAGIGNLESFFAILPQDRNVLREALADYVSIKADITFVVYNPENGKHVLLLVEVKVKNFTLMQFSQLNGYLVTTGCNLGLLVNIDADLSQDFALILGHKPELLDYAVWQGTLERSIKIGLCTWNTTTQRITFVGFNPINTIDALYKLLQDNLR